MKAYLALSLLSVLHPLFTNALSESSAVLKFLPASDAPTPPQPNAGFVQTQDNHFTLNGKPFDFRGFKCAASFAAKSMTDYQCSAPTLQDNDTLFQIQDIVCRSLFHWLLRLMLVQMRSVAHFGAPVTRMYTLTVSSIYVSEADAHINGWDAVKGDWKYNEAVWRKTDQVLAEAAKHGVKIIFPIINADYGTEETNWKGNMIDLARGRFGIANYTDAQKAVNFWTNSTMISAFEKLVTHVMKRKNTVNGRIYSQDDAIFAWETGNELNGGKNDASGKWVGAAVPGRWTVRIAKLIKRSARVLRSKPTAEFAPTAASRRTRSY